MNTVILMGRLTADPEVRYMNNEDQTAYLNFSIAVNRDYDRGKADFIRCKTFSKTAETISTYLHKGDPILVTGSWETGSYEDRDGNTVYTNECRVNRFEFVGGKKSSEDDPEPERNDRARKGSGRSGRR